MAYHNISAWKRAVNPVIIVMLFACATSSHAGKSGFLENYKKLGKGKYLDRYWSDAGAARAGKYHRIYIKPVQVDHIGTHRKVTPEDCRVWLESLLKKNAGNRYITVHMAESDEIIKNPAEPTGGAGLGKKKRTAISDVPDAPARMELAVTGMHTGSRAGRFFAGSMHAGQAKIRVEGRVVDTATGKLLAAFSVRRKSYSAIGVGDIYKDIGPILIRELLSEIVDDILKELEHTFQFGE